MASYLWPAGDQPQFRDRGYFHNGKRLTRVSTILGEYAKPGLDQWKRKLCSESSTCGFAAADQVMAESADRGTAIHEACAQIASGYDPGWVLQQFMAGPYAAWAPSVQRFALWSERHVARFLASEDVVVDTERGYAGKLDLLVQLQDGTVAIADVKTSKTVSEDYRLQLQAYSEALQKMGHRVDRRIILWLPHDLPGQIAIREYTDDDGDAQAWQALVTLYWFRRRVGRDWLVDKKLLG